MNRGAIRKCNVMVLGGGVAQKNVVGIEKFISHWMGGHVSFRYYNTHRFGFKC